MMNKLAFILGFVCILQLVAQANAVTIFSDSFDDLSNVSVGIWDEWGAQPKSPTWTSDASPGGKSGNCLHASWDGSTPIGSDPNITNHRTISFSSVAPTTGTATYLMQVYISGPSNASAMIGSFNQSGSGANNFQIDRQVTANAGQLYARVYSPYELFDQLSYQKDTWYTVAWVIDDLTSTSSDAHLYLAQGLSVGVDDYIWTGNGVKGPAVSTFDLAPYVHLAYPQAWDMYFDNFTVNTGVDFTLVPEPGTAVLVFFAMLSIVFPVWRRQR